MFYEFKDEALEELHEKIGLLIEELRVEPGSGDLVSMLYMARMEVRRLDLYKVLREER